MALVCSTHRRNLSAHDSLVTGAHNQQRTAQQGSLFALLHAIHPATIPTILVDASDSTATSSKPDYDVGINSRFPFNITTVPKAEP